MEHHNTSLRNTSVTVELTSITVMSARCNSSMKTVLVQTSDRNYCAWVLQPSLYWKWLKKQTGWSAMVRTDPSMVYWITKLWDIQQGYKPAFSSLDSEVFELGELRDERRSPAKGSLGWQRDKGSRTAKCVQRRCSVLGPGWGNLDVT